MLSVALVFSFYAMKSTVTEWANQGLTDVYMYLAVRITGYAVIAAGIFVVVFSMKYYIKVRLRDYSLFLILGMKKRMLRQFIGMEYLLGWIVSLGTGILLGNGVQILFKFAVRKYYGGQAVTISVPLEVYKYTFIISVIMILVVLAVIAVLLEERGMSNLITAEVKKERRPVNRHWLIVVLLGTLVLCVSYVFMNQLGWNYFNENGTYSLAGCVISGGILMMFGGSLLLERVRKNEKYYFKKTHAISGGEKQRTAICRALVNSPGLLLADEPTGNLDSKSSEIVIQVLEEINEKFGKTILLVTHDPIVASHCKKVLFLKDGNIVNTVAREGKRDDFYKEILVNIARL
ncbi:ATP-binding cassette domain-containing protein [Bariatricus massiliensis]|nr:ATP-binding cassette domain-containing protein [Bariatricus massiliensis]MDY2663416.1 FtsX-like permease family protein [Bariatricus massiliensis]